MDLTYIVQWRYENVNHTVEGLDKTINVNREISLFQDLLRLKRGFKSSDNLPKYVNGFYIVRNLLKLSDNGIDRVASVFISHLTIG